MRRLWLSLVLTLGIITVSALYLRAAASPLRDRMMSPLDDAYVAFQYARQIARGYPYQYNTGDPPTTGMTSTLLGFLFAGVYRLGIRGESLAAFAVGLGVVWLGAITWLTYRLTAHLVSSDASAWHWPSIAAGLVALTGAVTWGCFNGMETGLFTALTLAALHSFLTERTALCTLWLALAGLTRPEGIALTGLLWTISLVDGLWRSRSIDWKRAATLSIAILAGLIPSLINWALTGTTASTALQGKSWLFNAPAYPDEIIRSTLWSYQRILRRFLGLTPYWLVPPGLLALSVLGGVGLGIRQRWKALSTLALWFIGGTLASATLITATWHMGRYLVPFAPPAIALATYGLSFLWNLTKRQWQRMLVGVGTLLLLAASIYSTHRYVNSYRRAVSTMARQHATVAGWLRENLPADARIGVADAGILRYIGQRPTYDLVGLTTADAAIPWRNGPGSAFEQMEHSPRRPDYFATHSNIPYLMTTDLFGPELFRVEVPEHFLSAGKVQAVRRADWLLVGSGEQFYQSDVLRRTDGLEVVDALDVADLEDEGAHSVTWWEERRRVGFITEARQFHYRVLPEREVLDGGRLLTGGIAFDVTTEPHQPLWIVARLHAQQAGAVQVDVHGHDVGRWAYPPVPGEWLETLFRVPAETITRSQTRITLTVDASHYDPYFFWFLQGQPEESTVEIQHRTEATFDETLSLLGFDLPERAWHPGDVLPVTLYWQAQAPTESDVKVFLHLYDADGNLGPQSDGWPFYGTRPPYTWAVDEIIADPRKLPLPADLPAGEYALAVGLYHPDGAGRLPAYLNDRRQPEDRVPLATINVTELVD